MQQSSNENSPSHVIKKQEILEANIGDIKGTLNNILSVFDKSEDSKTHVNTEGDVASNKNISQDDLLYIRSQIPLIVNKIKLLEEEAKDARYALDGFAARQNNIEQRSRLNNLIWHKANEADFAEKKQGSEFSEAVVTELNKLFKLKKPLVSSDIDASHFLRKAKPQSTKRNIIIRFVSRDRRNDLFYSKKLLKGTGMILTEQLTKHNLDILNYAKKVFGNNNFGLTSVVCLCCVKTEKFR